MTCFKFLVLLNKSQTKLCNMRHHETHILMNTKIKHKVPKLLIYDSSQLGKVKVRNKLSFVFNKF